MKITGVFGCVFCVLLFGIMETGLATYSDRDDNRYSFEFSGEPLNSVLEKIVNSAEVDLIYDPILVEGFFVYQRIRDKTLNETLMLVLDETGLDFIILSTGTYVIVESVKGPSAFGTLSGLVADAQTGEPLPGATIMFADASGGTTTNLSGRFNFSPLVRGTHEIVFSYVGYRPVKKQINIDTNVPNVQHILLQPAKIDFSPVVVTAHKPFFSGSHMAEQQLSELDEWESGGRMPDAIRSLNLHTGVQNGITFTDVHIQGAQKGDHRLFLDGAPVYNPSSFGQMYSAFSQYAIGRVQVEKAGFSAPSGSYISGKINMNHDLDASTFSNALLQINPLTLNARGSVSFNPVPENKLSIMSAYRSSFQDMYSDPVLNSTLSKWDMLDPLIYNILNGQPGSNRSFDTEINASDIQFYDFHTAARYDIGNYQSLKMSIYTGENQVFTDILSRDRQADEFVFARDRYKWKNLVSQISYDWLATPRLGLRFQGSYSSNRLDHTYSLFNDTDIRNISNSSDTQALFTDIRQNFNAGNSQFDDNDIRHFIVKSEADYSVSPTLQLGFGLQYDYVSSRFNLTDVFYLPTLTSQKSHIFSTYFQTSWMLTQNLKFEGGSRFSALNAAGEVYVEPRLSLQYDRENTFIGYYSLKLSGGMYHQFVNQFDITNVGPSSLVPEFTIWMHDATIRQPKAYHASLSAIIEPDVQTSIHLETYTRIQPSAYITSHQNLMVGNEVNREGFDAFAEISEMESYGVGIRINRSFLESKVQLMGGYDFTVSRVNMETQFGRWQPAPWNEPHRIQLRALGRIHHDVAVVAKWQGIYGRKWAFRQSYYDFMVPHSFTNESGFDFTNPGNDKLRAFEQFDVSFIYTPDIGITNVEFRVDFINILNRSNTIDLNLYYPSGSENPEIRERKLPGFNPSFSIRFSI